MLKNYVAVDSASVNGSVLNRSPRSGALNDGLARSLQPTVVLQSRHENFFVST